MYRRSIGSFIAAALGLAGLNPTHYPVFVAGSLATQQAPNGAGRSNAAAIKRAARTRRNIRARSSKRRSTLAVRS